LPHLTASALTFSGLFGGAVFIIVEHDARRMSLPALQLEKSLVA
jgi:hypothetical protein